MLVVGPHDSHSIPAAWIFKTYSLFMPLDIKFTTLMMFVAELHMSTTVPNVYTKYTMIITRYQPNGQILSIQPDYAMAIRPSNIVQITDTDN